MLVMERLSLPTSIVASFSSSNCITLGDNKCYFLETIVLTQQRARLGFLTLDANNDPFFIFHIGSALTTDSSFETVLINQARSCAVYWFVKTSASLG
jgi:hypothetical protein